MRTTLILTFLLLVCATSAHAAVAGVQVSKLNQIPNPAQAGANLQVQVVFRNVGSTPVENIIVDAIPDYPFSLPQGVTAMQTIAVIPAYPSAETSSTLTYDFLVSNDVSEGTYLLKFRYSLNKGIGWSIVELPISVTSKFFSENIEIDKTSIMPGIGTPITFTIHNLGGAPLKNALFSWSESTGILLPVGSGNSRYIGYLAPGESEQLQYTVMASVDAKPDLYTLNMNLQYETALGNQTSKNTLSTNAGIFIGGQTDFDVAFSESSAGQTSLSVANIGITPAYSVTVRIPEQPGYKVDGPTVAIVGNLDKGDYTLVSFQITQTGSRNAAAFGTGSSMINRTGVPSGSQRMTQQGNLTMQGVLKVLVEYTDGSGKRNIIEKNVPVQFKQSGGFTGRMGPPQVQKTSVWTYVIYCVIVVVIGGVGYCLWKRFSKKGKRSA